jgi:hypothetical protein
VVRDERDILLELAAQLREPAPVSVTVLATLAWLALDESSPVYVGELLQLAWPRPQLDATPPSDAIANVSEKASVPSQQLG